MGTKGESMRQAIVEVADKLIYQRGFHQASFADFAAAVGVPKGNFYYYFKSKDELLQAVIDRRLRGIEVMLQQWRQEYSDPRSRLKRFLQILSTEGGNIQTYGCPLGSLMQELGKTDTTNQQYARQMFDLFKHFLIEQFKALGHTADAETLAMHLLTWTQGVAVMSCAYKDPDYLRQELAQAEAWVDAQ